MLPRMRVETSTGDRTRPPSCASHGRIFAVRSTSGFDSQLFAECTSLVGTSAPCSRAYTPAGIPDPDTGKTAACAAASLFPGPHQLRNIEHGSAESWGLPRLPDRCRPARSWWCRGRCRYSSTYSISISAGASTAPGAADGRSTLSAFHPLWRSSRRALCRWEERCRPT